MTLYATHYSDGDPDPTMEIHRKLVSDISKLLGGNNPAVMGSVIAEMMAKFVAGHDPSLRKKVFEATVEAAKDLVPVCAEELVVRAGLKNWSGGVDDAPAAEQVKP